ncbi:hypothetical protein CCACVL1_24305 [Corchorus capsularis]|uniref:Uncharacterized protein n=1 Tax=Corchorus capsularis TaxID=210143 RepID=A0A1R3GQB2_COCAP|nr:hypothetical protein CCACVL1_24305 [Corchorus capsularis]
MAVEERALMEEVETPTRKKLKRK